MKLSTVLLATCFFLTCISGTLLAITPPEYLGVYVLNGQQLVPIEAAREGVHDHSLTDFSAPASSGLPPTLVVYAEGASAVTRLFMERVAPVRFTLPSDTTINFQTTAPVTPVSGSWHGTGRGYDMRIAPLPQNPQMMVRAVGPAKPEPGLYAVKVNGQTYVFRIGAENLDKSCLVSDYQLLEGGWYFTDCDEFFSKQPHRRPGTSAASVDSGRQSQDAAGGQQATGDSAPAPTVGCATRGPAHIRKVDLEVQIRQGASSWAPAMGVLQDGEEVTSLGVVERHWCRIQSRRFGTGWVHELQIVQP